MKKKSNKNLSLAKETMRTLQSRQLERAAGGCTAGCGTGYTGWCTDACIPYSDACWTAWC